MNPAYSVILFTVLSGAGYGLLAILGFSAVVGLVMISPAINLTMLVVALVLITAGLISSTSHLGRPERAWRALSQWRTSWLSREGVFAVITYVPAVLLGIVWITEISPNLRLFTLFNVSSYLWVLGGAGSILSIATVICTGQIYATLRTIPAWYYLLTTPIYLLLSVVSGFVIWMFLMSLFGYKTEPTVILMGVFLLELALILKWVYWRYVDRSDFGVTKADAIGFASLTKVQNLEPAHQTKNYLMREMGYQVARSHSVRLRRFASWTCFIIPGLCLLLMLLAPSYQLIGNMTAVVSLFVGLLTERWLFLAEAKHVVTRYY